MGDQLRQTPVASTATPPVLLRRLVRPGTLLSPSIGALVTAVVAWSVAAVWASAGAPAGILAAAIAVGCLAAATGMILEPPSVLLALIPVAALPMTGLIAAGTTYVPTGVVGTVLLLQVARDRRSYGLVGLPPRLVLGAVAGFLVWSTVAALASAWRSTGATYVVGMAATLTICFLVAPSMARRYPQTRRAVLETIALCGVIAGTFDVVLYLVGPIAPFNREIGRYLLMEVVLGGVRTGLVVPWATGPFLSPASASAILVTALLALLALRSEADRRWSRLIVGGITLVGVALILTWTRTGWLAACAGLAVMTLGSLASGRLDRIGVAWLAAFVILMGGVLLGSLGADLRMDLDLQRYRSADSVRGVESPSAAPGSTTVTGSPGPSGSGSAAGNSTGGDVGAPQDQLPEIRGGSTLSGRLVLWTASVDAVRARPITGWGPGTNPEAIAPFLGMGGASYGGLTSHSTWLRTAVETGIPGLVLVGAYVLGVLGFCLRRYLRRSPLDLVNLGLFAVFVSLLFWETFESTILGGVAFPAFLWALSGALVTASLAPLAERHRTRRDLAG
jgi:O-Antigen ligase